VLPGAISNNRTWTFWLDYADEKLRGIQWGSLTLSLTQGLRVESFWKYAEPRPVQPDAPSDLAERLKQQPANSSLLLVAESAGLRETLLDLRQKLANAKAYKKHLAKFEKNWEKNTGSRLPEDWIAPMGDSLGLALTGFGNGLLFPIPAGRAWLTFSTADGAARLQQTLAARALGGSDSLVMPLGRLDFRANGDRFDLWLNEAPAPSLSQDNTSPTLGLLAHPLLKDVWKPGRKRPTLCLFVNLQSSYGHLERMYQTAAIWSKKVRKNIQRWTTILVVLRYMDALCLTATPVEEGVKLDLVVPVR
jgi:hypothetical protein